ncbi:MAG: exodeoxyribonuclease VII large subunit [Chloroflexi bacterium]|nr:MAG: exodeoxyribonuclease VII large subunit [Chloroflexota bacterium]
MGFFAGNQTYSDQTWTVTDLTAYIRELFEIDYRLQDVEVSGEISNFTQARSGHLYFTLKDAGAQLKCVMWRSSAKRLHFSPGDGDAVVATGKISVYEAGGAYQLYATSLASAGRGSLAIAFEQLKQRLADEGLFEAKYKKPIPAVPKKIGIVTSADAAALRDILNVLSRRYPLVSVLIAPTLVQGADAPPQIVSALQWLDGRSDIDTIIVARGGGSVEDLWAFNDERVARAIFRAQHPIIAGVGHEVDFTIADFVADQRAPTPSAAAEMAVPDIEEMRPLLQGLPMALTVAFQSFLQQRQWQVQSLQRTLSSLSPQARLNNDRQRVDMLADRLERAVVTRLDQVTAKLKIAEKGITAVSPQATLDRGYAIVRDKQGHLIHTVNSVQDTDQLDIQVADGQFQVVVTNSAR